MVISSPPLPLALDQVQVQAQAQVRARDLDGLVLPVPVLVTQGPGVALLVPVLNPAGGLQVQLLLQLALALVPALVLVRELTRVCLQLVPTPAVVVAMVAAAVTAVTGAGEPAEDGARLQTLLQRVVRPQDQTHGEHLLVALERLEVVGLLLVLIPALVRLPQTGKALAQALVPALVLNLRELGDLEERVVPSRVLDPLLQAVGTRLVRPVQVDLKKLV